MKSLLVFCVLVLAGCASQPIPVQRSFPSAPEELTKKCEKLRTVENNEKGVPITDMLKVIVHNYGMYYECAAKVEGWNDWYTVQKQIFNSVK